MSSSAMAPSVLVLVGVLLVCAASGGAGAGAGFSVEFIHRDSPRSPFHEPALTAHGRVLAAAHRSMARAADLAVSGGAAADDVVSKVVSRSFEYLMAVNVGSPPLSMLAIADTGSDLVWVKCKKGSNDTDTSPAALSSPPETQFDPSRSSTYSRVSCQSDACAALGHGAGCDDQSNCLYLYAYGDGSNTTGLLSTETFTFDSGETSRRSQVRVGSVKFGCSTATGGSFPADGLVGLGGGAVSLVTQLAGAVTSLGRRFSYCLIPHTANTSSALNFGALAAVSEPGAASTPLVASGIDTYYTVALDAVKVGDKTVATASASSPSSGNIIVDSGTTLTFLHPSLMEPLVGELSRRIDLPRIDSPDGVLDLCYDVTGTGVGEAASIPDVTLEFGGGGGAEVVMRAENAFVMVEEGTLCLAMVATTEQQPVSILGNLAQENIHVGYDLDAGEVTFAAADCVRSSSPSSS